MTFKLRTDAWKRLSHVTCGNVLLGESPDGEHSEGTACWAPWARKELGRDLTSVKRKPCSEGEMRRSFPDEWHRGWALSIAALFHYFCFNRETIGSSSWCYHESLTAYLNVGVLFSFGKQVAEFAAGFANPWYLKKTQTGGQALWKQQPDDIRATSMTATMVRWPRHLPRLSQYGLLHTQKVPACHIISLIRSFGWQVTRRRITLPWGAASNPEASSLISWHKSLKL